MVWSGKWDHLQRMWNRLGQRFHRIRAHASLVRLRSAQIHLILTSLSRTPGRLPKLWFAGGGWRAALCLMMPVLLKRKGKEVGGKREREEEGKVVLILSSLQHLAWLGSISLGNWEFDFIGIWLLLIRLMMRQGFIFFLNPNLKRAEKRAY